MSKEGERRRTRSQAANLFVSQSNSQLVNQSINQSVSQSIIANKHISNKRFLLLNDSITFKLITQTDKNTQTRKYTHTQTPTQLIIIFKHTHRHTHTYALYINNIIIQLFMLILYLFHLRFSFASCRRLALLQAAAATCHLPLAASQQISLAWLTDWPWDRWPAGDVLSLCVCLPGGSGRTWRTWRSLGVAHTPHVAHATRMPRAALQS